MIEITEEQWTEAARHVRELKTQYDSLVGTRGVNPTYALVALNSYLTNYAHGDRTRELYEEMVESE